MQIIINKIARQYIQDKSTWTVETSGSELRIIIIHNRIFPSHEEDMKHAKSSERGKGSVDTAEVAGSLVCKL